MRSARLEQIRFHLFAIPSRPLLEIQMAPRQITVFGGSGFIGRYLVKRLADDGWRIVIAVRDPEAAQF